MEAATTKGCAALNKKTVALSTEEYEKIIAVIQEGFRGTAEVPGLRPNPRVAMALVLEANLGLRIGDILQLKLMSFIKDGARYRLDIEEEKTGKKRTFTVPTPLYIYIENYALRNNIRKNDLLLPISSRTVQSILKMACDHLGYVGISTHSFRKYYATEIYRENGCDIILVQHLLQHCSPDVTRRYIGVDTKQVEDAILKHMKLL